MSKYCAKRVNSANRALAREVISKIEAQPACIDLTGRRIDPAIFPVAELKTASQEILRIMGPEALQYSSSHDYMPLKEELARRYAAFGLSVEAGNFTITNGSVQAIDMLMKVLVNEGDTILAEAPLFWRVRQTMSMYRPNVIDIPLTDDGVDLAVLEEHMKAGNAKFFFCSPNHQEPTGVVYSAAQRSAIAALARKYQCIVVEYDVNCELGTTEERLPYIMPETGGYGIVIGSVSQLIGPGLRIGWVLCTHPVLLKYFTEAKQKTDSHANGLIQRVLWKYLAATDVAAQAAKVRALTNEKRAAALETAAALAGKATFRAPEGGNCLWLTLPEGSDSVAAFHRALDAGVAVIPGKLFGDSALCARSLYLNFGGATTAQLREGIQALASAL